jgi:hypothetical protein
MKHLILILLLAVSFTGQAQKTRTDISDQLFTDINATRTTYGIWKVEKHPRFQAEADSVVNVLFKKFDTPQNVKGVNEDEFKNFFEDESKNLGKATMEGGEGIYYGILHAPNKTELLSYARQLFMDGWFVLNPLAYRVTISVVEGKTGRLYATMITYR